MNFLWTRRGSARQGRRVIAAALALAAFAGGDLHAATLAGVDVDERAITLRFDDNVASASAFLLDGPQRIAVDVGGATAGRVGAAGGIVAATRQAQRSGRTTRVVFDLAEPAVVTGGGFAPDGRALTLTVRTVEPTEFASTAKGWRREFVSPVGFRAKPPRGGDHATVRIPIDPEDAPAPSLALPRVNGARGSNRPLVVIDAGHGGHDPGSIGAGGQREKDAALAIARAVRDEIAQSGRVRVAMTRDDDRFLVLGERREIARRLGADLFISIHADSAPNAGARGASIYTLSEVASDRYAAALAARENRADVLNGVDLGGETNDVSSILIDLAQRETMNVSSDFAGLLEREMAPGIAFKNDYHRFAGLVVLKAPDMPSVLIETGYISNVDDVKLLFSKDYQHKLAVGIRKAVETHFARKLAGD